jgi:hypothetical protein
MLKSLTFGGSLVLLASAGFAQQQFTAQPAKDLKHAGVYHMATGTWTRTGQHANLGPKVLYTNTAQSGFYGVNQLPGNGPVWTDEGRVPSTGGHANAKADSYTVNGFDFAYCSNESSGVQNGAIAFYDCYTTCTDPTGLPTLLSGTFALPGGNTAGALCWIVTFDLTGSTDEFTLSGDCDGVFDGTTALDNFGWTISLQDVGGGGLNGPILNGDPNNFPYGDGTYYQNAGATIGSGLGTQDRFWSGENNGCYWFGGYPSGNPFGSFWLTLYGDNAGGGLGTKYCTANNNSTGSPADLTMTGTSAAAGDVTLTSSPVPNQPGIFFHAANQAQLPFGNGFLCATGNIIRGAVVGGVANTATYVYDNSDAKHSLQNFVGATRNFQHWYRDPMGGGALYNTSNAINWTIQ